MDETKKANRNSQNLQNLKKLNSEFDKAYENLILFKIISKQPPIIASLPNPTASSSEKKKKMNRMSKLMTSLKIGSEDKLAQPPLIAISDYLSDFQPFSLGIEKDHDKAWSIDCYTCTTFYF